MATDPIVVISTTPMEHPRGGEKSLAALLAGAPAGTVFHLGPVAEHRTPAAPIRVRNLAFVLWLLRTQLALRRAIRASGARRVHANDLSGFMAAWLATIGSKVTCSMHVRDVPPNRRLWRFLMERASVVVCVSEDVRDAVRAIAPSGTFAVVHNPVTSSFRKHAPVSPPYVLMAGAIERRKGLGEFVADVGPAIARLGWTLQVAGEVLDRDELGRAEQAAAAAGLSIEILGYRSDIEELLLGASALAVYSLREGLPRIVLEACAMAVPVVSRPVQGLQEALGPELAPWSIVPSGDEKAWTEALIRVEDRAWAEARARRRRELMTDWTPEAAWRQFDEAVRCAG